MINPPSDIILDVVRAADPGKQAKATQRLAALAGDGSGNPRAFAAAMESSSQNSGRGTGAAQTPFRPAEARIAMQNRDALGAPGGGGAAGTSDLRNRLDSLAGPGDAGQRTAQAANQPMTPEQQFEAFILRTFVETMLPDDATASYGSGTAGDIWKGMKAEQIGNAMARSGGIGIAEKLAKLHPSDAPSGNGAGFGVAPSQAASALQAPSPGHAPSGNADAGAIERLMAAQADTAPRPALEDLAARDDIFSDPHEASLFFAGLWRNGG